MFDYYLVNLCSRSFYAYARVKFNEMYHAMMHIYHVPDVLLFIQHSLCCLFCKQYVRCRNIEASQYLQLGNKR